VDAARYDAVYHAAVDVLRDRGFVVDRQDYRFGTVASEPLGAGTLVEVWRPNHATMNTALNASLNDHRRTVILTLAPLDPPAADPADAAAEPGTPTTATPRFYWLDVEVVIERRQDPRRRVGGAARGGAVSYLSATPVELTRRGITGTYWLPVGRDTALEQELAVEVLQRAGAI